MSGRSRQEKQEQSRLYSVGEVCSLTGVTRKTLFYYDRIGLLTPTDRDGAQNFKQYDEGKLARLRKILEYRDAGLRIAEIRQMLDSQDTDRIEVLQKALLRLQKDRSDAEEKIRKLRSLIDREQG